MHIVMMELKSELELLYSQVPNKRHDRIKDTMPKYELIAKRHDPNKRHGRSFWNYLLKDMNFQLKDTMCYANIITFKRV